MFDEWLFTVWKLYAPLRIWWRPSRKMSLMHIHREFGTINRYQLLCNLWKIINVWYLGVFCFDFGFVFDKNPSGWLYMLQRLMRNLLSVDLGWLLPHLLILQKLGGLREIWRKDCSPPVALYPHAWFLVCGCPLLPLSRCMGPIQVGGCIRAFPCSRWTCLQFKAPGLMSLQSPVPGPLGHPHIHPLPGPCHSLA